MASYSWDVPVGIDFSKSKPIFLPYRGCSIVNKVKKIAISGYVSIEDYSASSIAVTICLSDRANITNLQGDTVITIISNDIYEGNTITLTINCTISRSGDLNDIFPTTFIIEKCIYKNAYLPIIYRNEKNNAEKTARPYELKTFTEHHHPVQLDFNTKYSTFSNDQNEEYESSMLGSKLNASNIKVIDLTRSSIDLDLPNGKDSSSNLYKSSIGLSLDTTLTDYIDRNILEEDRYSSRLAIERIIFMSNRINVLGNTINEIKTPSIIKDEYVLSSNMLEPSKENELRKLSAVKPDKLANFFVGAKRIDEQEVTLTSVVSFLEIYDNFEFTNPIKINLLATEDVLIITNHYHQDGTSDNDGVDIELYYNNELIDTIHIMLGNCDSIYVNLDNEQKVSQYHITEQCTSMHYDAIIRTNEELKRFASGDMDYSDNMSVLIKKNEDEGGNGMYFTTGTMSADGYDLPYVQTLALESDVFIANVEVRIHPKTKVINYRGYCSYVNTTSHIDKQYPDTTVANGNGLLYYNYGKYDIVISSQKQLDEFLIQVSGDSGSLTLDRYKDKIIFIDRNHDNDPNTTSLVSTYSITSGGKMTPSTTDVKAIYKCRALYINSYIYMNSPASDRLFFSPSNGVNGYINVTVNGFNCDTSGYTPINTALTSTNKNSFSKTGTYYNTTDWCIKPYGSDTWYCGKWLIHYKDLATITARTNYFKITLESIDIIAYKSDSSGNRTSTIASVKQADARMKFSFVDNTINNFVDGSASSAKTTWCAEVGSGE